MNLLRTICLFFLLLPAVILCAQDDPVSLSRQADIHFRNSEWFQALRVYEKLLTITKNDPKLYVDAIVVSSYLKNQSNVLYFTGLAKANQVPMDTLFGRIQDTSRRMGKSMLYERYLNLVKNGYPELSRLINQRLMDYYSFRNDDIKLGELLTGMLVDEPENLTLRKTHAEVLFNNGNERESVVAYQKILDQYPREVDALLFLGNYYYVNGIVRLTELATEYGKLERPTRMQFINYKQSQVEVLEQYFDVAAGYLERARDIRSTPVLRKILRNIAERRNIVAEARYTKSRN